LVSLLVISQEQHNTQNLLIVILIVQQDHKHSSFDIVEGSTTGGWGWQIQESSMLEAYWEVA
jgi:hypothetical protein